MLGNIHSMGNNTTGFKNTWTQRQNFLLTQSSPKIPHTSSWEPQMQPKVGWLVHPNKVRCQIPLLLARAPSFMSSLLAASQKFCAELAILLFEHESHSTKILYYTVLLLFPVCGDGKFHDTSLAFDVLGITVHDAPAPSWFPQCRFTTLMH